ncbi:hypothetical protein XENORESO_012834 [Xenotaenia resolanae]|uniref:Uncharacterized protein n=1 Tax=Xenotaenia resolanae TaxID=208358 RepID=A0ABV0W8B5_9TELE
MSGSGAAMRKHEVETRLTAETHAGRNTIQKERRQKTLHTIMACLMKAASNISCFLLVLYNLAKCSMFTMLGSIWDLKVLWPHLRPPTVLTKKLSVSQETEASSLEATHLSRAVSEAAFLDEDPVV